MNYKITEYAEKEKERLALSNSDYEYQKLLNKRSVESSKSRLGHAVFVSYYDEIKYLTRGFFKPRVMTSFSEMTAAGMVHSGKRYYDGSCLSNSHFIISCHQDTINRDYLYTGMCRFDTLNGICDGNIIVFDHWFEENLGILIGRYQYGNRN